MINTNYAWSTHQPLIKAVLKAFDIKFVMEMGIGVFSTPLFIMYGCETVLVENEEGWIDYMNYYCNKDLKCIHHKVPIPNQEAGYDYLTPELIEELKSYYSSLKYLVSKNGLKLLFVDNYSSCRALTVNTLYSAFDIVIYHDCEPQSIARQNYYFDEKLKSNYVNYLLTSPRTWTGCFIKKEIDSPRLSEIIKPIMDWYKSDNGVEQMNFTKS